MKWAIAMLLSLACGRPCLADFNYNTASRSVVTVFCESSKSLGGGVVVSKTSIISMQHVVAPCRQVIIGYYDGTTALGNVVGADEARDLVHIRPEQLPDLVTPSRLDVDIPEVGDPLHVIGHLNGMTWTYSQAYLTYPHERLITVGDHKFSVLVVNSSSFAGSSGGALFNDDGHVIGFAKGMLTGTSIAYYIPSRAACQVLIKCKV